jgi:hypothetical protein
LLRAPRAASRAHLNGPRKLIRHAEPNSSSMSD